MSEDSTAPELPSGWFDDKNNKSDDWSPTHMGATSLTAEPLLSADGSSVDAENVIVVDEHNHVTGVVPRARMRAEKLCHRATYVFVFNKQGQIYVQERTMSKDIYPGYFEPATGGVVAEGESYDVAAHRELAEELGVEDVELAPHFHFYFHNDDCKVWGRVYSCQYDGELSLQEEEVAGVVLETPDEILSNHYHRQYTPDSLMALERLIQSGQLKP